MKIENYGFLTHRDCTKCLVAKNIDEFYSKGSRIDSWCKSCKKTKRRASYIVGKNSLNKAELKRLKSFVRELITQELSSLNKLNSEISDFINSALNKTRPNSI